MQPGKGVPDGVTERDTDEDAVLDGEAVADTETVLLREPVALVERDVLTEALHVRERLGDTDGELLGDADVLAVTDGDQVWLALADRVGEFCAHPCGPAQYWQPSPAPPGCSKMSK
jgi:hypothetical protein